MAPSEHHPLAAVEGFIVISGDSTNGQLAQQWGDTLQLHEPDREVQRIYTGNDEGLSFPDLEERNRHRLAAALAAGDIANKLVIVGGGDGSVHYAVRALLHGDMPESATSAILTSWALGNANDFYHATQDGSMVGYPLGTLEHPQARITEASPLAITDEDGNLIDYSLLYWTAGPTAVAAALFGSAKHRGRKEHVPRQLHKAFDSISGTPALWLPEQYEVSINGGEPVRMTEMQVNNADRMAIEARYPSRLERPEMHVSMVRSNSPLAVGATALRMKLGHPNGKLQTEPISIRVTSKKPVPAQSDGEPGVLLPGSTTIIQPSERRVRILATKRPV